MNNTWKDAMGLVISIFMIVILAGIVMYTKTAKEESSTPLRGKGTMEEPFLIESVEDLECFRDYVNGGESFSGKYFLQTDHIDLQGVVWEPIGLYGSSSAFMGIYDGGNHEIRNLLIEAGNYAPANHGFFGQLGGIVVNLGIGNGSICGDYIGGIASHSAGDGAAIINCYNNAELIASGRAGGICDNFNGLVIACYSAGKISAPVAAKIVSYNSKALLNIAPKEGSFVPDTFTGKYHQILEPMEGEDFIQTLNQGVEYLKQQELWEEGLVKTW